MSDIEIMEHIINENEEVALGNFHIESAPEAMEDPATANICLGCE